MECSLIFSTFFYLYFLVKPDEKPDKQTFYGLKDGETNTVRFQFMANPKPSSGVWKIGETTVPIGAADTENTLTSSQIEDGVSFFLLEIQV